MKPPVKFDYCVVGAGPSGLTVSYQLLRAGKSVCLIERDSRAGGLAKSYNYAGQIFDTGPKRFHTDDPKVLAFIREITDGHIHEIGRSTKVYFLGKYFKWPLQSQELFKMPLGVALRCTRDLLKERPITDKTSFHQLINSRYGQTLYEAFFQPYTQKFLRWDVEDIHSDWATTGINRTVIDKRIKANSLVDLMQALLLPEKIDTKFLYPTDGGFGGFFEKLLGLCRQFPNFKLILSDRIVSLKQEDKTFEAITAKKEHLQFSELIWSGNLNNLASLTQQQTTQLHYLNTVFYNLVCLNQGLGPQKAQWIYVSQGNSLISRITCMKEFAPYTCKEGYYNLICELTEMRFLKDRRSVQEVHIVPVEDTYPIYHRHYSRDFSQAAAAVKKFSKRIHLLGRCGAFWYNNSDHSIRFALEMADQLLHSPGKEFNYRNYFG